LLNEPRWQSIEATIEQSRLEATGDRHFLRDGTCWEALRHVRKTPSLMRGKAAAVQLPAGIAQACSAEHGNKRMAFRREVGSTDMTPTLKNRSCGKGRRSNA
jgi:hypothetical protein